MEEAFKDFKFPIGEIVEHRTTPVMTFIVAEQHLIRERLGISRYYVLTGVGGIVRYEEGDLKFSGVER